MNAFLKSMRVGLVMLCALGCGAGAMAAANALTQLVTQVKAVGPGQWVGWNEVGPTALYYFREGEQPQSLGKLPDSPLAMAVGNGRVLWVGSGYRAIAPLNQLDQVKVTSVEEEWDTAVGNAQGFLIKDGAKLVFSRDGELWQPVKNADIDENTRILGMAASADQFALLLAVDAGQEGSDYIYSLISVSEDGLNWKNTYYSDPNPGEPELTMLGYGNGRWMAMGVGSSYTSGDGWEWTPSPVSRDATPMLRDGSVETGGGEWWVIDWRDRFQFSPDGLDWSAKAESLYGMKGAGPIWVVGPEGMRNLALDGQGRVKATTLATLLAGPPKPEPLDNRALAKQWAQLDEQLHAQGNIVEFSRKLGELSVLFSQAPDTAIGEAVRGGALTFVLQRGDVACLAAFKPALNDQAYRDASFMMGKTLALKKELAKKGQKIPPVARGERGDIEVASQLDLEKMRLNLLSGVRGSAYDLSVAYHVGNGIQPDRDMSYIWHLITQQLIPGVDDYEKPESVEKLLAAGSAITAGNSLAGVDIAKGEAGITEQQWKLIAQAATGGLRVAESFQEARNAWRVGADYMPAAVWPPRGSAATKWDVAQTAKMKSLFDRHVAFSRDVMAYRAALTPGGVPDRTKWEALVARHQALLKDPEIGALYEAYVQSPVAMAMIFSGDMPIDRSWQIHMKDAKAGLASVAINPDLWAFRAHMLQWSGQLDEARRDAAIAVLLLDLDAVKADMFYELLEQKTRMLQLELNLPASVLAAPQKSIVPYNLSVTQNNAFLGKLEVSDYENITKLYGNLGARLKAAWALSDPELKARVETDLFKIHGMDLKRYNYPEAEFAVYRKRVEAIWVGRSKDMAKALSDLEEVLAEIPHPSFLLQRGLILESLDRSDESLAVVQNVLVAWPGYKLAQNRLATLNDKAARADDEKASVLYKEALAKLNRGDRVGGRVLIDQICALKNPPLSGLLLLAELQGNPREVAQAESTVRRAYELYPDEPQAAARLGLLLLGQRKVAEARQVIDPVIKAKPRAPETQAVGIMADVMNTMTLNSSPGLAMSWIQGAIPRLDALKSWRFAPEVHAISAQVKMMLKDQAGAVDELVLMANGMEYVQPEMWFQIGQLMRNMGNAEGGKQYIEKAADLGLPQAKELLKQL